MHRQRTVGLRASLALAVAVATVFAACAARVTSGVISPAPGAGPEVEAGVEASAATQPAPPTPEGLFPAPEELPVGFEQFPGIGIVEQGPDVSRVSRIYVRENLEVGPSEETLLEIEIAAAASLAAARAAHLEGIAQLAQDGASLAPLGVSLGEEANVGRRRVSMRGDREVEEATVLFRTGTFVATVMWTDYADLPNVDDASQVARLVERRITSAPR